MLLDNVIVVAYLSVPAPIMPSGGPSSRWAVDTARVRIAMRINRIFIVMETCWDKKGGWIKVGKKICVCRGSISVSDIL